MKLALTGFALALNISGAAFADTLFLGITPEGTIKPAERAHGHAWDWRLGSPIQAIRDGWYDENGEQIEVIQLAAAATTPTAEVVTEAAWIQLLLNQAPPLRVTVRPPQGCSLGALPIQDVDVNIDVDGVKYGSGDQIYFDFGRIVELKVAFGPSSANQGGILSCASAAHLSAQAADGRLVDLTVGIAGEVLGLPTFRGVSGHPINVLASTFDSQGQSQTPLVRSRPQEFTFQLGGFGSDGVQILQLERPQGCSVGANTINDNDVAVIFNGQVYNRNALLPVQPGVVNTLAFQFKVSDESAGLVACTNLGTLLYIY